MNSIFTTNEACMRTVQHLHNCINVTTTLLRVKLCLLANFNAFCPTFISLTSYKRRTGSLSTWMPRMCLDL